MKKKKKKCDSLSQLYTRQTMQGKMKAAENTVEREDVINVSRRDWL